jgi:hypothetical protein
VNPLNSAGLGKRAWRQVRGIFIFISMLRAFNLLPRCGR